MDKPAAVRGLVVSMLDVDAGVVIGVRVSRADATRLLGAFGQAVNVTPAEPLTVADMPEVSGAFGRTKGG